MDLQIGLLGCGTVGGGVVELTRRRAEKIEAITGRRPVITHILVRDLAKQRPVALEHEQLTTRVADILEEPNIQVIIETIGGIEPAKSLILSALKAKKHVITANKDLIAVHGAEILETAEQNGVSVFFEAAVGGAIPLIRPLKESLTANAISDLKGIVNGTTNYILSKMTETGADFDDVLKEAQELGYAESDPSSDVDGLDAARKLTILATIGFHAKVRLDEVIVTGIRAVTAADVAYASEIGCVIKLLAAGSERDGVISLNVRPTLVPKAHPLAHVSDAYNALFVRGDAAGDLMFFGRGAGSLPTASAVVGDLIEVLRNIELGVSGNEPLIRLQKVVNSKLSEPLKHYLRLSVEDKPGVFAKIAGIFGDSDVSMETVLQKRVKQGGAEVVIVTHEVSPVQLESALLALQAEQSVQEIHSVMPVEVAGG
ncbi:homoserine dehydrogenase [Alicyclobacillus tolerans]|uniref:homoserine dehydrogenase n=1 Tax=Alicyclobacillus tolerans TaxID=90970 RepID=UPI001F1C9FA2|nr:homoserine dehydrogenase [Alicyclobacillus tolerans]MCF8566157.1 homoserine dehydrogenase [Alicyclobacillus tolerans]